MKVEFVPQPDYEILAALSMATGDGLDRVDVELLAAELGRGKMQCYRFMWEDTSCYMIITIQEGNNRREMEIVAATGLGRTGFHIREWSRLTKQLAKDCQCDAVFTAVHNIRLGEALNILGWKPAYVTLRLETENEHEKENDHN